MKKLVISLIFIGLSLSLSLGTEMPILNSSQGKIKFNWIDASYNGKLISISRYGVSNSIKLPFSFPYKNDTYEYLIISKDGWIGLSKKQFKSELQWKDLAFIPQKDKIELIITALPFNNFKAMRGEVYLFRNKKIYSYRMEKLE